MRAIDLYAGIGGWGLGLRLAGVELVTSYEWWRPAIDTHNGNLGGNIGPTDIRGLKLADLPPEIDVVVGSPPCTEFSYSNRGGSGDIAEGLKDLVKFLEIVDYLKPKFWALENVPRVANVLRKGLDDPKHALHRFRHLNPQIEVVDFSDYGTPQSRKRCIAGNIPFGLVKSYRARIPPRTLRDVVSAVAIEEGTVLDPVWSVTLPAARLTETEAEAPLDAEQLRMNREAKAFHPVYNDMSFPDAMDVPARTVTATCTRVSRESIVIADVRGVGYRRLTIRERASLQGFPITYQFYARSFAEKAKMIGNAIPPTFTFLLASATRGVPADELATFGEAGASLGLPTELAPVTVPDAERPTYPARRRFRAALPGLRFKSGMRFELSNRGDDCTFVAWRVRFFFGPSKDIREIELDGSVLHHLHRYLALPDFAEFRAKLVKAEADLCGTSPQALQDRWAHRASGPGPYEVVDLLGDLAAESLILLKTSVANSEMAACLVRAIATAAGEGRSSGVRKLERYALPILAGFVTGAWFNTLGWHSRCKAAA